MPHPPNKLNAIRVVRGQTKTFLIRVRDQDGRPAKIGQASDIRMTVRGLNGNVKIEKSKGSGIEVTDAAKAEAKVTLSSSDTDVDGGRYRYDIWMVYPGDPPVREPVVKPSDFIVSESVTTFS